MKKKRKNEYGKSKKGKHSNRNNGRNLIGKTKKTSKKKVEYKAEIEDYHLGALTKTTVIMTLCIIFISINSKSPSYIMSEFMFNIFSWILVASIIFFIVAAICYIKLVKKYKGKYLLNLINISIVGLSVILPFVLKKYANNILVGLAMMLISLAMIDMLYCIHKKSFDKIIKVDIYFIFNSIMIFIGASVNKISINYIFIIIVVITTVIILYAFLKYSKLQKKDKGDVYSIGFSSIVIFIGILYKINIENIGIIGLLLTVVIVGIVVLLNIKKFSISKCREGKKMINLQGRLSNMYNLVTIVSYLVNIIDLKNILFTLPISVISGIIILGIYKNGLEASKTLIKSNWAQKRPERTLGKYKQ